MKIQTALITVTDQAAPGSFYRDVLGLDAVADLGTSVTLEGGIALQKTDSWKTLIQRTDDDVLYGADASSLYYEDDDAELTDNDLNEIELELMHPQKKHVLEQRITHYGVADTGTADSSENMYSTVRRLLDCGMTVTEIARRMNVTTDYVKSNLN